MNYQPIKGDPGILCIQFIGTSNPLDEKGGRPAFIEEARCHLTVSLLIEYDKLNMNDDKNLDFETLINARLHRMKWASGRFIKC